MHIECVSNGMGAPSMYLMVLASQGKIPCDVVITADTGSEEDNLLSNGERMTGSVFYNDVIEPLGNELGIITKFVRSRDKKGNPLPSIKDDLRSGSVAGVPFFGDNGGRLKQKCTEKWKIRAVRQELRRMGATSARSALGLTMDEVGRMKQKNDVKWYSVWWPMIRPFPMYKAEIRAALSKMGIPYMLSSQCDMCPHQNLARWENLTSDTIAEVEKIESSFDGLYFTSNYIPLSQSIDKMKQKKQTGATLFDVCESGYCFT